MQLTSLSLALTRAGFLSFSPASLFAAGEPGVWYEPSLTNGTCFQDSSGTTPVTAVEQPVGLILDKSKGLVLGSELVTNGDFSNGLTGWTSSPIGTGTATVVNGQAVLQFNTSANRGRIIQQETTVSGRIYEVRITVVSGTPNLNIGTTSAGADTFTANNLAAGSYRYLVSSGASFWLTILPNTASTVNSVVDNISVRELPGNHATQTTATSRPVLSARVNLLTKTEQFDDVAWTKVANGVSVTPNATTDPLGGSTADKLIGTAAASSKEMFSAVAAVTSGASYTASVYAKAAEYSWVYIVCNVNASRDGTFFNLATGEIGNTVGAGSTPSITSAGDGWYRVSSTLSATTTSGYLEIFPATANGTAAPSYTGDGTSGIYIWGASLVPANQSSLPYQRVNTATDYDADPSKFKPYLRFDGVDDWLVTPTITPGTDKAQVFAGVRKLSDAVQVIYEFGNFSPVASGMLGGYISGVQYGTEMNITGLSYATAGNYSSPVSTVNSWQYDAAQTIGSLEQKLRVNTEQQTINPSDAGAGNFLAYPLYIGRRGGTTLSFNGHLYGLIVRFGANLPAATIASTETWLNQRTGAY